MAVRQRHHLGETGGHAIDLVDHPLGSHDVDIADDLHRSVVDARKTLPQAAPAGQRIGTIEGTATGHLLPADEYMHGGGCVADIRKRSWVSRSTLLYQGSQYVLSSWLSGSAIISEKLVGTPLTL